MTPFGPLNGRGLRLRIALSTALVVAIGLSVLIGLVLLVVDRSTDREVAADLMDRSVTVADGVQIAQGRLSVDADDARFGGLTWVFDASGARVSGPRAPTALRTAVRGLARTAAVRTVKRASWDLRAVPVGPKGAPVGVVVVAVDTMPYRSILQRTALAAGVIGVVGVLGMTVLAWLIVGRALAPVARMSATAGSWSEERLGHRFDLGPPKDELTALGAVLDSLLDRVSRAIEAEQRLTAELAHELRTPLTVIRGEAGVGGRAHDDAAGSTARFGRIAAAADDMAAAMTALLDTARGTAALGARSDIRPVVDDLLQRRPPQAAAARVTIEPAEVAVPRDLLERILSPVLENADRYAAREITIAGDVVGATLEVHIGNDGPRLTLDEIELFAPGGRGAESPGTGLGLALARRMARSAGGDVRLGSREPVRFDVLLPRSAALLAPPAAPVVSRAR